MCSLADRHTTSCSRKGQSKACKDSCLILSKQACDGIYAQDILNSLKKYIPVCQEHHVYMKAPSAEQAIPRAMSPSPLWVLDVRRAAGAGQFSISRCCPSAEQCGIATCRTGLHPLVIPAFVRSMTLVTHQLHSFQDFILYQQESPEGTLLCGSMMI